MASENLTKEIIKTSLYILMLIVITVYITLVILNNIRGGKTTSFYTYDDLMVEIQEVIDKEVSTTLDNDNRKVVVTNNGDDLITYQILMSTKSDTKDLLVKVDNRIRSVNNLSTKDNSYIIAEYDLYPGETNQTLINIYLEKGSNRKVKVNFKVIERGGNGA